MKRHISRLPMRQLECNAPKTLSLNSGEVSPVFQSPFLLSRHLPTFQHCHVAYNIFATIISYLITRTKRLRKKKTITNECMRDKNTSFHYNSRCFAFYGIILHFRSLSLLYSGSMKFNVFFCRNLFLLFFLSNIFRQFLLLITGTRRRTGYSYKDGSG